MKWLLFFFLPFGCFAQTLKPGVYRDLKLENPITLDTGSFTFINLEMKNLGKGVWLDGRKAKSLTLQGCRFHGNGSGIGLFPAKVTQIENCRFEHLVTAIQVGNLLMEKETGWAKIPLFLPKGKEGKGYFQVRRQGSSNPIFSQPLEKSGKQWISLSTAEFPKGVYLYEAILEGRQECSRQWVMR